MKKRPEDSAFVKSLSFSNSLSVSCSCPYKIALGDHPVGHKVQQGDERTPEGKYKIDLKNDKSQFHLSLRISYPNAQDRLNAKKIGVDPGGDIFIHGLPPAWRSVGSAHVLQDWTNGCIAVTSEEIDEIWKMVDVGTLVEIRP